MVSHVCCSGCVEVAPHSTGAVLVTETNHRKVGQAFFNFKFEHCQCKRHSGCYWQWHWHCQWHRRPRAGP